MIRGHLKVIVLKELEKESLSGYSLMSKIKAQIGTRPSPGSVYPLMDMLKRQGYVTLRISGNRKLYSLTKDGREYLLDVSRKLKDYVNTVEEGIKIFETICDTKFLGKGSGLGEQHGRLLEELRRGNFPFLGIEGEISGLNDGIMKVCLGKQPAKLKKLKKILLAANREIQKLSG